MKRPTSERWGREELRLQLDEETRNMFNRYIYPQVLEAPSNTPFVLIHGPRQSGKTTLAKMVGDTKGFHYGRL